MPKTDDWSELAREIAEAQPERGPRYRFDDGLRGRVVAVVQKRIAAGDSITALIRELGLGRNTLTEWLAKSPTRGSSMTTTAHMTSPLVPFDAARGNRVDPSPLARMNPVSLARMDPPVHLVA